MNNIPPQNIDFEAYVLGSMIMSKSNRLYGLEKLRADDFYSEFHQIIFRVIDKLEAKKVNIDLTTIKSGKVSLKNKTKNIEIELAHSLSEQGLEELMAGGKLTLIKQKHA